MLSQTVTVDKIEMTLRYNLRIMHLFVEWLGHKRVVGVVVIVVYTFHCVNEKSVISQGAFFDIF